MAYKIEYSQSHVSYTEEQPTLVAALAFAVHGQDHGDLYAHKITADDGSVVWERRGVVDFELSKLYKSLVPEYE